MMDMLSVEYLSLPIRGVQTENGEQLTDSFRVELKLIEVVEYSVFIGVDGSVVSKTARKFLLGVMSSDDNDLR